MRKRIRGSFTAEAAVLLPVLVVISIVFVYILVYAYDKTLMIQDVNSIIAVARDEGKELSFDETCQNAFYEIKKEHPYLSIQNLCLDVKKGVHKITVRISGDWKMPVVPSLNRSISYEREAEIVRPVEIMYVVEKLKDIGEGMTSDIYSY